VDGLRFLAAAFPLPLFLPRAAAFLIRPNPFPMPGLRRFLIRGQQAGISV
jgi:hypothetical protein